MHYELSESFCHSCSYRVWMMSLPCTSDIRRPSWWSEHTYITYASYLDEISLAPFMLVFRSRKKANTLLVFPRLEIKQHQLQQSHHFQIKLDTPTLIQRSTGSGRWKATNYIRILAWLKTILNKRKKMYDAVLCLMHAWMKTIGCQPYDVGYWRWVSEWVSRV